MTTETETGMDLAEIEAMEMQELALIEAEMDAKAAELAENLTVSSVNISNANKKFTMPDGTDMGNKIEVIILGHIKTHELYPDVVYNANKPEAPICFSKNKLSEASIPHKSVEKPECDTCDECPNNEWGSKGEGKACKEKYKVAVIVPAYDPTTPVILSIASTAMKSFDSSIGGIQKAFGANGKLAMPCKAIVSAEFTEASYPLVKITGTNARPNPDFVKHFRLIDDVIDTLVK